MKTWARVHQLLSIALLVVTVSILPTGVSIAATLDDQDAFAQQTIDAGNRTIALLINKFRPHFPTEHLDLLSQDRIKVVYAADFNAYTDYDKRRIMVPAQFLGECLMQIQAFIALQANPALRTKYLKWLKYMGDRSYAARLRALEGEVVDDVPVRSFWAYTREPAPKQFTDKEQNMQEMLISDALGLIVGHELGHLALNHRKYNEISAAASQRQEYEADRFAAKLLRSSDISVIPGLVTFYLRFAQLEALDKGIRPEAKTHPPTECRFYRIMNEEMSLYNLSDQQRRDFERGSGMTISQLHEFLGGLRERCER